HGPNNPNPIWAYEASIRFVPPRWEQYLFVWNTQKVTIKGGFQHEFAHPHPPLRRIGFPLQLNRDRPPWLGFWVVKNGPEIGIAIMHSPSPNGPEAAKAAQNMALVQEFKQANTCCILLGDFNIPHDDNAKLLGSKGHTAFGPLVQAGFEQCFFN